MFIFYSHYDIIIHDSIRFRAKSRSVSFSLANSTKMDSASGSIEEYRLNSFRFFFLVVAGLGNGPTPILGLNHKAALQIYP